MPITIQMISRSHVAPRQAAISTRLTSADRSGAAGRAASENGRSDPVASAAGYDADRYDDERHQRADADQRTQRADRRQAGRERHRDRRSRSSTRAACGTVDEWPAPIAGSSPSFAIARKMRGCASIITTITELRAASAPTHHEQPQDVHHAAQAVPAARPQPLRSRRPSAPADSASLCTARARP